MQATRIIAIRHGETAWNVDTRIQGQLDVELNETGLWQARQVALAWADVGLAVIHGHLVDAGHARADQPARVIPFWNDTLAPAIRAGQRVVVAAHGNSIRALIKYLDGVSDQDIVGLNIPNGIPLVYELDANLRPTRHHYLGDAQAAARAAAAVAAQGKA